MTKRHVVRTPIDEALLIEMEQAGEIKITSHNHVFGLEGFIKRAWNKRRKK